MVPIEELLPGSPLYVAVSAWAPTPSELRVRLATPEVTAATPRVSPGSPKTTWPGGASPVTGAVRVIARPAVDGLADDVSVVVVSETAVAGAATPSRLPATA